MLKSMTGFGSEEARIAPLGKVRIELKSSNHKFLDMVFHLPDGFLSLEDRIKKEIEAAIKRGRITCVVNVTQGEAHQIFINKPLLKNYILALRQIEKECAVQDELSLETLVHLPGVLSLSESRIPKESIWPRLKGLVRQALAGLESMRQKEGKSTCAYLKKQAEILTNNLRLIKARFKKVISRKAASLESDEERASFLKDTDISEELDRLAFHIRNFTSKLNKAGPVGKELDFIAQEMQREANTIAAKSCDTAVSARTVAVKSLIEKIREQAQNVE